MNKERFLIPANTKNGLLILSLFTSFDVMLLGGGVFATLMLIIIFPPNELFGTIMALTPALIAGLLVTPVPNYHNVLVVLKEVYDYLSQRQKFIWKGWQFHGEYEKESK